MSLIKLTHLFMIFCDAKLGLRWFCQPQDSFFFWQKMILLIYLKPMWTRKSWPARICYGVRIHQPFLYFSQIINEISNPRTFHRLNRIFSALANLHYCWKFETLIRQTINIRATGCKVFSVVFSTNSKQFDIGHTHSCISCWHFWWLSWSKEAHDETLQLHPVFVRQMQNHDWVETTTWADDHYISYKICDTSEQAYWFLCKFQSWRPQLCSLSF